MNLDCWSIYERVLEVIYHSLVNHGSYLGSDLGYNCWLDYCFDFDFIKIGSFNLRRK